MTSQKPNPYTKSTTMKATVYILFLTLAICVNANARKEVPCKTKLTKKICAILCKEKSNNACKQECLKENLCKRKASTLAPMQTPTLNPVPTPALTPMPIHVLSLPPTTEPIPTPILTPRLTHVRALTQSARSSNEHLQPQAQATSIRPNILAAASVPNVLSPRKHLGHYSRQLSGR